MSVTVLTRVRARPGGEAALIAAAVRSFSRPAAGGDQPMAHLFQGYDDPERFYWVAQWVDRELYLAGVPGNEADAWLNDVCEDTLDRSFFNPITEPNGAAQGQVVGGALVTLDAAAGRAAQAFSEQLIGQLRGQPGMAGVALLQGIDDAGQWLVLCGWDSEEARQRFYAEALPRYEGAVREHGGRMETFVERTLTEVDRYPREQEEPRPSIQPGRVPTD